MAPRRGGRGGVRLQRPRPLRRDRRGAARRALRGQAGHRDADRRRRADDPRGGRPGLRHATIATATSGSSPTTSACRPTSRRARPTPPPTSPSTQVAEGTRIRVGDPDTTVSGQHRYVLTYTLPDAHLSSGELALDVIGTDGDAPDRPLRGRRHRPAARRPAVQRRLVRAPRAAARSNADGRSLPGRDQPARAGRGHHDRRHDRRPHRSGRRARAGRSPPAAATIGSRWRWRCSPSARPPSAASTSCARRRGRNEVFAGGAADAAFGTRPHPGSPLPPPGTRPAGHGGAASSPTSSMDELATTEFAPPDGHRAVAGHGAAPRADRRRVDRRVVLRARRPRRDHPRPRRRRQRDAGGRRASSTPPRRPTERC